ncbi:hypothetical protein FD723_18790 [Nostoc sp. C052]|uniref:hypothetical protein n=1 Tax=Nostoc sp. C052 TaxID=2576902 RepID=UPI0015C30CE5|nr:hypothetical protein [Nostoc sp. C052]QLE42268.1 hypothetical protein FD723_18790 [Nostoc sp. C052]
MTYQETAYQKTNIVDSDGNVINSFGGSGGGGDASATNQQSQIDLETEIRDRLPSALINGYFPVIQPSLVITDITGTVSNSGDNTIAATPGAGLSIHITRLLIQNQTTTETTIILKDSSGNKLPILAPTKGDGIAQVYSERSEIKLAQNSPLILNLSGANSISYSIGYYVGT